MILDIDNILVSSDIITEQFCCDLDACKGICCVEGDAGAPVTLEEIGGIEDALDTVWATCRHKRKPWSTSRAWRTPTATATS